MGIIVALLVSSPRRCFVNFPIQAFPPHLMPIRSRSGSFLAAHAAIGPVRWRWVAIVRRWASAITKLTPFGGFAAETSGAITLFVRVPLWDPGEHTHTITGGLRRGRGAAFVGGRWGSGGTNRERRGCDDSGGGRLGGSAPCCCGRSSSESLLSH